MPAPDQSFSSSNQPRGRRRLWRTIKQVFYEVMGAIFAVLALGWFNSAFRAWTRDAAHWLVGVVVAFAGIFLYFAISSFRRSRQL
jgi:hypothetical protein